MDTIKAWRTISAKHITPASQTACGHPVTRPRQRIGYAREGRKSHVMCPACWRQWEADHKPVVNRYWMEDDER